MSDTGYLASALKQFRYYEQLGTRTFAQLTEEQLLAEPREGINSIAVVVKHLHGNMLSRWTDFMTADGEKEWRDREGEFEATLSTRAAVEQAWAEGWGCLFAAVEPLTEADLPRIIYIRNQGHTVLEAINRQLCHYAYHVGQVVYLGKYWQGQEWQSLSIPRGGSAAYNQTKFAQEKGRGHFTDEFLK